MTIFNCRIRKLYLVLLVLILTVYFTAFFNIFEYKNSFHKNEQMPNNNIKDTFKKKIAEVIHVGIVCVGHKNNYFVYTLIKSLLFYRNNPLHFHIMVDKTSEHVLDTLFNSWELPQVIVNYYNIHNYLELVKWVPNDHYSGVYGLLKLTFPNVVSLNITNKIIVIDTDLTFNADIYELWEYFDNFNYENAVGVIENESNFYLDKRRWPAINRGYNTGVILYDIEKLNRFEWIAVWPAVTKENLKNHSHVELADQDIINAIFKKYPDLVFPIPCQWNIQLSIFTRSHTCYTNNKIKVLHWNSPMKLDVRNKNSDYFRGMFSSFAGYDGNLLTKSLHFYQNNMSIDNEKNNPLKWRTLLFFKEYEYVVQENDITLVVNLPYYKFKEIEELSLQWTGPISCTFYTTDYELQETINLIQKSTILESRKNIAYHAVFKSGDYYPINILRNVGFKNVNTPYVFLIDQNFVLSPFLYSRLKLYINNVGNMEKKALIIPAFELECSKGTFPNSKKELIDMLERGDVSIFQNKNTSWYRPIDYEKWKNEAFSYQIEWKPGFGCYVATRSNIPEYDSKFIDLNWSKISHMMQLNVENYEFVVLPYVFIIHNLHNNNHPFNNYQTDLENAKLKFLTELKNKYATTHSKEENDLT